MASSPAVRPPSTKPLQLEITIVSAKHLKNVNWQNGDLKPYAAFWLDPDRRFTTQPDNSGSTRPVWNERFTLPINQSLNESVLTLEIFHSIPSEPSKPLVGTLRLPLMDLDDLDDSNRIRIFELCRPSGRPQGKIRLKLGIHERPVPDYHITPAPSYYYTPAPPHPSHFPPPPPHTRDYGGYSPSPYSSIPPPPATVSAPPPPYPPPPPAPSSSLSPYAYGAYSDNYSYYPPYNSQPPPPPHPRPFFERQLGYGGPSAPIDYSPYDQKPKGSKMGLGSGLAVGGVAGALGGLSLDESMKYEKEKIAERAETDRAVRDDYSEYRDY